MKLPTAWLGVLLAAGGACLPQQSDLPIDAWAGVDAPPLCDDSPPSQVVERHVWADNFMFYFTPAGEVITKLYVPANSLVRLRMASSLTEEAHIFQITLRGCATPELVMGVEGAETSYDWKAPSAPGTYLLGGICVNHAGMDYDIVVTP